MTRASSVLLRGAAGAGVALAGAWAAANVGHRPPRVPDLTGRVLVVTGATSGIGTETARAFARGGGTVVATARDDARGRAVVDDLRARTGNEDVHLSRLDLASLDDVRAAAADLLARFPRIDVLVNNAGAVIGERRTTVDGFELTFGANHLGPFLLTRLLLARLRASAPARVVFVSSFAHRRGGLDLDDLQWTRRPYAPMQAYGASKLANVLTAAELGRRVPAAEVASFAVHPGTVRSDFGRDDDAPVLLRAGIAIARRGFVDAERGAATTVHAATAGGLHGRSGAYLSRSRVPRASAAGRDRRLARDLWRTSSRLVGLPEQVTPAG